MTMASDDTLTDTKEDNSPGGDNPNTGDGLSRHPLFIRLVHWITALIMVWMIGTGLLLGFFGFVGVRDMVGGDVTNLIYKYHKTFGIIILGLVVIRLVTKYTRPRPAELASLPRSQQLIASAVHVMLYLLLIGMPVLGWLGTAAGGFPVEFFQMTLPGLIDKDRDLSQLLFTLHWYGGWAFVVLIGMHAGAGLFHRFIKRDGVFRRISLP